MNRKSRLTVRHGLEFGENSGEKTRTDNAYIFDLSSYFDLPPHEVTDSDEMGVHELASPMFFHIMANQS
jgi:hypothetical protein